jgi:hypothetical protein
MPKTVEDNESRLNELRERLATIDRERAEVTKLIDQIESERPPKATTSESSITPNGKINQNSTGAAKIDFFVAFSADARMSSRFDGTTQETKKLAMRRPAVTNGVVVSVKSRGSSARHV